MSVELYVPFLAEHLGCTPEDVKPTKGPAIELASLLYPFAQLFGGEAGRSIRELPYVAAYEADVDSFLEALEADPFNDAGLANLNAAHVFYERIRQAIIVCGANAAARRPMLLPPKHLPEGVRQVAAALLMLHKMMLPFHPGTATPR